jgi:hypothetical protein
MQLKKTFVVLALLVWCSRAGQAGTLFEQLPGTQSPSQLISSTLNNLGGTPGFRVADNFQLAGAGTVRVVEWWGTLRSGGASFQISFYPDAGGNPGPPLSTIAVTPTSSSATTGSGFDPVTFYSAILGTPFSAAPGTRYWMSVFDAAPDGRWLWLSANVDTFGALRMQNGAATWNATDGVSFRLKDDAVPEPATYSLVAIAMLGFACFRRWSRVGTRWPAPSECRGMARPSSRRATGWLTWSTKFR